MKNWIFIFSLGCPALLSAQNDDVSEIRKEYYKLAERITECHKNGFECGLYQNTLSKNVNGTSWPGVGIYRATTDFWYDEYAEEYILKKVVITSQHSDRTYTREFLYLEGELAFYYVKADDEDPKEKRYYFKNNQLIKYMENNEVTTLEDKSGISYILKESQSLTTSFNTSMGMD